MFEYLESISITEGEQIKKTNTGVVSPDMYFAGEI